MSSDADQKSEFVRQHKRMAMGEKVNGTSMQTKGNTKPTKPQGVLSQDKKK
jgi:hypothetical protein